MNRFGGKLKSVDFGPKSSLFTQFWAQNQFYSKIQNYHFDPFFDTCHLVQFQNNLMSRLILQQITIFASIVSQKILHVGADDSCQDSVHKILKHTYGQHNPMNCLNTGI